MDEESLLRDIAMRHESRANLALHLLGQRFGVLAGAPAFDAERLPVGPQALCRILREASRSLQIGLEPRLLLFRTFERTVMQHYTQLAETMNAMLERENVLPSLAYVPIRARPVLQNPEQREATTRRRRDERPAPRRRGAPVPRSAAPSAKCATAAPVRAAPGPTPPGSANRTATTPASTRAPRSHCCSNCCPAAAT